MTAEAGLSETGRRVRFYTLTDERGEAAEAGDRAIRAGDGGDPDDFEGGMKWGSFGDGFTFC